MKKKSMKWKKSGSTEKGDRELNIWYTGKVTETSMTNG